MTCQQSILLADLDPAWKPEIEALLEEHGIAQVERYSTVRRWSMACPAMPTCGLAVTEAERALPTIMDQLEVELTTLGLESDRFTVRMTGCPNGCARPYNADIGLVGRSATRNEDGTPGPGTYTVFLGGRTLGDRLNVEFKDYVPFDRVVPELVPVFARYKAERLDGETFGDFCHRVGVEALAEEPARRKIGGTGRLTVPLPEGRGEAPATASNRPRLWGEAGLRNRPRLGDAPMIPVLRDAGLSKLLEGDSVETVAEGLVFTEGPLWLPDGSLLFQDVKAEKIVQGRAPTGPCSLLRERHRRRQRPDLRRRGPDRLLRAERPADLADEPRRVERRDRRRDLARGPAQQPERHRRPLRRPALLHRPPLRGRPGRPGAPLPGGLRPRRPGRPPADPRRLREAQRPGLLARRADPLRLRHRPIPRPGLRRSRSPGPSSSAPAGSSRTLDPGQPGGPDGMKVDRDGRVYVAVALGVWVFEPDGTLLGILGLPQRPSNLNWGGPDGKTLAITAVDHVYQVRFKVAGLTPPFLPRST